METRKFLQLHDIVAYKRSFHLSNYVWEIVVTWEWFAKKTLGSQYTEAIDSISAMIAEGFGRFTKKDKTHYFRMAKGSTMESLDWTQKAKIRGLLTQEQYDHIMHELQLLPKDIHHLINFTNSKLEK